MARPDTALDGLFAVFRVDSEQLSRGELGGKGPVSGVVYGSSTGRPGSARVDRYVVDGVFEALAGEGVIFHPASKPDEAAVAQVQATSRTRVSFAK